MFVAVDLPEMVREDIADWGETALADPALRRVPQESLHVTLAFLGDKPLGDVERIECALEEVAEVPLFLELGGPVGRPARGRPRLIALPVTFPRPVEVRQAELAEILSFEGLYKPEKRPFWPHVTIARVRAEGRGSRPMQVKVPPGPAPTERIGFFKGVRISLYRSELQPSGARYVPLAQVELPETGWQ